MRPKSMLFAAAAAMAISACVATPTILNFTTGAMEDDDPYKPRHRSKGQKARNKHRR